MAIRELLSNVEKRLRCNELGRRVLMVGVEPKPVGRYQEAC